MFTLIHRCDEFIVISKKAGVSFHGDAATPSLEDDIRERLGIAELYALHRLDSLTSGLLVFARTRPVVRELAAQFRERRIEKFYLAIGGSHPKKKQGIVSGDMKKRAERRLDTRAHPRTPGGYPVLQHLSAAGPQALPGAAVHRTHPPDPGCAERYQRPGARRSGLL